MSAVQEQVCHNCFEHILPHLGVCVWMSCLKACALPVSRSIVDIYFGQSICVQGPVLEKPVLKAALSHIPVLLIDFILRKHHLNCMTVFPTNSKNNNHTPVTTLHTLMQSQKLDPKHCSLPLQHRCTATRRTAALATCVRAASSHVCSWPHCTLQRAPSCLSRAAA